MKIEIVDLTEENLGDAPEFSAYPFSCKYCLYWEHPEEFKYLEEKGEEAMMKKKMIWLKKTRQEFGNCGKMLYIDGKSVGYAQYAPPKLFPNAANYSVSVSNDAVLLSCLYISREEYRYLMSMFLKAIINELKGKAKAIETFATRKKGNFETPSGPMEFYLQNGFKMHKDDKVFPLMRLDI